MSDKVTPITPHSHLVDVTSKVVKANTEEHPTADVLASLNTLITNSSLSSDSNTYLVALKNVLNRPSTTHLTVFYQAAVELLKTWTDVSAQLLLDLVRLFHYYEHLEHAVFFQAHLIAQVRLKKDSPDALKSLAIALYNQASLLASLQRLDEAIAALEEVVAIDEQLDLDDLNTDKAMLVELKHHRDHQLRRSAPSQQQIQAELITQLAEMPLEAQAYLRESIAEFETMSPNEQDAALITLYVQQLKLQAAHVIETVRHAHHTNRLRELLPQLETAAEHFSEGEAKDSPYAQLSQFIQAIVALIRQQSLPPIPEMYQEQFVALQTEITMVKNKEKNSS